MILPVYAYGQPVLKKMGEDITPDYPELAQLIADMWETMYHAEGVGLAAPQIGLAIRLFVVDTSPFPNIEGANQQLLVLREKDANASFNKESTSSSAGCL